MNREMKDSGIPWIGEIPENWEVKRLKQESIFINGFAFDSEDFKIDEGVRVIRIGDIGLKAEFENCVRAITNSSILKPYRIEDGDILIAMSGATTGKCCIVDKSEEAYINQRVGIIRSDIRKIIYYSLQTPYFMEFVNLNNAGSAQPNISSKAIGEFPILSIPITEQQRIAEFLDRKCAEVDEMIGLQEQIIEELKAYKQSVITETVTKGLNPDAPMRDSGIEWIGQIPEHWEVKRLKQVLSSPLQYGANESGMPYQGSLPRYVRITDILDNSLRDNIEKQSLTEQQADGYILQHNDILFARSGGTVGKSFIFNEKYGRCAFAGYLIKASVNELMDAKFVYYFTQTNCYEEWKKQIFIQSTIQNIGADRYSQLQLTIPPTSEQQAIADYLDEKCADIDSLIQTKQSKIDSLKEYKKSIIYEYITGKREVNE